MLTIVTLIGARRLRVDRLVVRERSGVGVDRERSQGVDHVHPADDLSEDRVLAVEAGVVGQVDVELDEALSRLDLRAIATYPALLGSELFSKGIVVPDPPWPQMSLVLLIASLVFGSPV